MNRSLLLAGILVALVSTRAFAQSDLLVETPSPTVVYCDLVTVGATPADDGPAPQWLFESGSRG